MACLTGIPLSNPESSTVGFGYFRNRLLVVLARSHFLTKHVHQDRVGEYVTVPGLEQIGARGSRGVIPWVHPSGISQNVPSRTVS